MTAIPMAIQTQTGIRDNQLIPDVCDGGGGLYLYGGGAGVGVAGAEGVLSVCDI